MQTNMDKGTCVKELKVRYDTLKTFKWYIAKSSHNILTRKLE